tara:strand:- start:149 stop:484 length:336 start_codon:yes stop_codon:yes gene_type:complete
MDYFDFIHDLNNILEFNDIKNDLDHKKERDNAIKLLLRTKKNKATIVLSSNDVLYIYKKEGINGIKKHIDRKVHYLYSSDFVFHVLFYHYKNDWTNLEKIIIRYDKKRKKN